MVFCGQCGLQLAPGSTGCPRCGAITEPAFSVEDPHLYDPTIVSSSFGVPAAPQPPLAGTQRPPIAATPPQPQQLVLRPDGNVPSYNAVSPYEPTSMMPQSDIGYQPIPPKRRNRGGVIALLTILLVLLLLLGTIVTFVMNPGLLRGILGHPTATPIVTQTVLSPSDQARAVMRKYYSDINAQDYQGAYNLWGTDYQNQNSYSNFAAGYAHTRHDKLTINSLTPLANGTVSVAITIDATEDTTPGLVHSIYNGTYIVGQENGTWKLLSGTFHKVS